MSWSNCCCSNHRAIFIWPALSRLAHNHNSRRESDPSIGIPCHEHCELYLIIERNVGVRFNVDYSLIILQGRLYSVGNATFLISLPSAAKRFALDRFDLTRRECRIVFKIQHSLTSLGIIREINRSYFIMGKDFFDEKTTAKFEIAIQVFQFYAIYILHYASIALLEKMIFIRTPLS